MTNKDTIATLKQLKEIGETLTVLVVEDELIAREQLHYMLSHFCNNIDLAKNGIEALSLYKEKKHDLIITDLVMPEMSGIDMIHELHKINANVKIIVSSAHNENDLLVELLEIGADGFIQKPLDFHKFLNILYKVCHQIYEQAMNSYLNNMLESINKELLQDTNLLKKELDELKKKNKYTLPEKLLNTTTTFEDVKELQSPEIVYTPHTKMSAKDFFETYPLELDQTNEDLEELENRLNHLILNAKRQVPEQLIHDLVTIVSSYAKTIETIPQFGSLAFAIRELAYTFESAQEKMQLEIILPMLSALINNLEQWRLQIFFFQEVEDIHYMDNSILSDAMSLQAMIDSSSQPSSAEDEFEFF